MPGRAMGMRLDEVRPSFDVFSLGKVLWAMVSGQTKMRLWYFDHPDFDLVRQFPGDERMRWVNRLLAGSVREHERLVWPHAGEFLEQLDIVLAILRRGGQVIAKDVPRYCRACSYGIYRLLVREGQNLLSTTSASDRQTSCSEYSSVRTADILRSFELPTVLRYGMTCRSVLERLPETTPWPRPSGSMNMASAFRLAPARSQSATENGPTAAVVSNI
jgi:hypothetical protein